MQSPLDPTLLDGLMSLPVACADLELSHSTVYARAAELATRLSITAAFSERLSSELGLLLGCARDGALTPAGKALATFRVESYQKTEASRETIIRARAALGSTSLTYSWASDEHEACFSLRSEQGGELPLLRVHAKRERLDGTPASATRVVIHAAALAGLDRRCVHSGLDVASLCHVLVGFVPECLDEEWEVHEMLIAVIQRNQRRARARRAASRGAAASRRWWRQKVWWRCLQPGRLGRRRPVAKRKAGYASG